MTNRATQRLRRARKPVGIVNWRSIINRWFIIVVGFDHILITYIQHRSITYYITYQVATKGDRTTMSFELPTAFGIKALLMHPSVLGGILGTTLVLLLTMPSSKKQQAAALISTIASSFYGGGALIDYYHLADVLSSTTLGGVYLVAGIPAWVIVRAFFYFTEKNKRRDPLQVISDVRKAWKGDSDDK